MNIQVIEGNSASVQKTIDDLIKEYGVYGVRLGSPSITTDSYGTGRTIVVLAELSYHEQFQILK